MFLPQNLGRLVVLKHFFGKTEFRISIILLASEKLKNLVVFNYVMQWSPWKKLDSRFFQHQRAKTEVSTGMTRKNGFKAISSSFSKNSLFRRLIVKGVNYLFLNSFFRTFLAHVMDWILGSNSGKYMSSFSEILGRFKPNT